MKSRRELEERENLRKHNLNVSEELNAKRVQRVREAELRQRAQTSQQGWSTGAEMRDDIHIQDDNKRELQHQDLWT